MSVLSHEEALGYLVGLTHILIYVFMTFAIFSNNPKVLIIHVCMSLSLLMHWALNDDTCVLTEIECRVRGIKSSQTLTHAMLGPLLQTDGVVAGLTVVLLIISAGKLWLIAPELTQWKRMK